MSPAHISNISAVANPIYKPTQPRLSPAQLQLEDLFSLGQSTCPTFLQQLWQISAVAKDLCLTFALYDLYRIGQEKRYSSLIGRIT